MRSFEFDVIGVTEYCFEIITKFGQCQLFSFLTQFYFLASL